ncbi:lactosylceramide 4-alpha-galactosyltransferase-like [Pararge aegeria]|uniref:lactosylceramide 4-alpha-galactosyltransferase-like n=1 Tax=Pararge aegeria TaxID=116150 RepID=UPI0019D06980|nr:lactosylceramide 4-alpha-galactosyltransferase-like [Pararge aegeria]XP_039754075.1 lactosylceramide 4-alpha-galactosyltransferase-like [Pararge aegeria]
MYKRRTFVLRCIISNSKYVIHLPILALFTFILSTLTGQKQEHEMSCPFVNSNSTLPVLERSSNLPSRSIFMYATSCPGNLTARQHCSIESAAITHPEWQINVVFTSPTVPSENLTHENFNNVKFWSININEFCKGTPLGDLIIDVLPKCSRNRVSISLDVLKYLTLAQWGGIYLDIDMVVAQPLRSLARNWATRESDDTVGEGVLAFSRDAVGRKLSGIAVNEMQSILCRGDCIHTWQPTVMTKVLKKVCSTPDTLYMSSATCNGFEIYGPQFFHPIPEVRAIEYFVPGELSTTNAYTYNLWDHITKDYKVMRSSPLTKLAKRFCPLTFKMYSDQFGF